jgi:hypothetical protein
MKANELAILLTAIGFKYKLSSSQKVAANAPQYFNAVAAIKKNLKATAVITSAVLSKIYKLIRHDGHDVILLITDLLNSGVNTLLLSGDNAQISQHLIGTFAQFLKISPKRSFNLMAEAIAFMYPKSGGDPIPASFMAMYKNQTTSNKIPHEHIKKLEPLIKKLAGSTMSIIITGSYRRGLPFSSDIDLQVVSKKEDALDTLLDKFIKVLKTPIEPYSKGPDKMSFIADFSKILGHPGALYKVDAFRTIPEEATSMMLFSTGSKEFNILMRSIAKRKGYRLNQKGLYKNDIKVPGLKTEADYFQALGMKYREPSAR